MKNIFILYDEESLRSEEMPINDIDTFSDKIKRFRKNMEGMKFKILNRTFSDAEDHFLCELFLDFDHVDPKFKCYQNVLMKLASDISQYAYFFMISYFRSACHFFGQEKNLSHLEIYTKGVHKLNGYFSNLLKVLFKQGLNDFFNLLMKIEEVHNFGYFLRNVTFSPEHLWCLPDGSFFNENKWQRSSGQECHYFFESSFFIIFKAAIVQEGDSVEMIEQKRQIGLKNRDFYASLLEKISYDFLLEDFRINNDVFTGLLWTDENGETDKTESYGDIAFWNSVLR